MQSAMAATFDQIYYGGKLFQEIYGVRPAVWHDEGLIERETLHQPRRYRPVQEDQSEGRRWRSRRAVPSWPSGTRWDDFSRYFERDASVYIGDGDIYPELASELEKYRKPSGASLLLAPREALGEGDALRRRLRGGQADGGRRAASAISEHTLRRAYMAARSTREHRSHTSGGTGSDLLVKSLSQVPRCLR